MINAEVLIDSKKWEKIIRNPKIYIKDILNKFPNRYKFIKKKVSITILLTNNKNIKLLNKKFRKKDKPTDILSFPFFEKKDFKKTFRKKNFYLGDIIISYQEFSKKK